MLFLIINVNVKQRSVVIKQCSVYKYTEGKIT